MRHASLKFLTEFLSIAICMLTACLNYWSINSGTQLFCKPFCLVFLWQTRGGYFRHQMSHIKTSISGHVVNSSFKIQKKKRIPKMLGLSRENSSTYKKASPNFKFEAPKIQNNISGPLWMLLLFTEALLGSLALFYSEVGRFIHYTINNGRTAFEVPSFKALDR